MKKLTFLLPLAVAAMVSCSNSDEVFESAPQLRNTELKLFPQIQGNTRGVVETTSSLSAFDVIIKGDFAASAIADVPEGGVSALVTATKSGSGWSLATNYYWGGESATGTFTAFANAYDKSAVTASSTQLVDQTVDPDLADQKDLLVAFNSGAKSAFASGVPLHFRHAMSQVVVNASYTTDTSYPGFPALNIKVKSVKFVNLADKGTLTLPTASTASGETYTAAWSAVSGTQTFECNPSSPVTLGTSASYIDQSEANNPLLLMPQTTAAAADLAKTNENLVTGAFMMLEVDIDYAEEQTGVLNLYPKWQGETVETATPQDQYAWIAVPVSIDWKAGYKYTYTLNFSNIACGKAAPGATAEAQGKAAGAPIITGVKQPLTFLVTVESEWQDGASTSPVL